MLDKIELEEIVPSSRKYPFINFKAEREMGNEEAPRSSGGFFALVQDYLLMISFWVLLPASLEARIMYTPWASPNSLPLNSMPD